MDQDVNEKVNIAFRDFESKTKLAICSLFSAFRNGYISALQAQETPPNQSNKSDEDTIALANEFCKVVGLTEIQLITMKNFMSWIQQRHLIQRSSQ